MFLPIYHNVDTRIVKFVNLYRISRGRRVVENAFGILANRWRCLLNVLAQHPKVVIAMVHAVVCLHNLMRMRMPVNNRNRNMDVEDDQHNLILGEWRKDAELLPMDARRQGDRELEDAKRQRQLLTAYFCSPAGSVPWQDKMVPLPKRAA